MKRVFKFPDSWLYEQPYRMSSEASGLVRNLTMAIQVRKWFDIQGKYYALEFLFPSVLPIKGSAL